MLRSPSRDTIAMDHVKARADSSCEVATARPLAERALHVTEATYGPDHPTVGTRLDNLALLLRDLGEPATVNVRR